MPALQRLRMSYDEYLALPEGMRAEWVDGEVVVTPPPSFQHQIASRRISRRLEASLPDLIVVDAVGVELPGSRVRIPDVVAVTRVPDGPCVTDAPVIALEVLSPSTRSEDLVRKSTEYLAAGVSQYWVVDPEDRSIVVYRSGSGGWEPHAHVDDRGPTTVVPVPPYGEVPLDLTEILRPPG